MMKYKIDFVGRRKLWYALSLLVIIPGLLAMMFNSTALNYGIDFTGGNIIHVRFNEEVTTAQVREVLSGYNLGGSPIQAAGNNEFIIRTVEIDEEQSQQLITSLREHLGEMEILRNEKVGAVIGREITVKGLQAIVVASILMIVYITFRFEFLSGLAAIIAIVHDVLITVGLFAIFRWEVDSTFIAALLTIIGYSINDTIVIFDRIRENLRMKKKETLEELVNRSVRQNITRSVNTGLTVLAALLALFFLGGETTKNFALAMIIGTISGTYSSIFIASALWIDLKNTRRQRRRAGSQVSLRKA